MQFTGERYLPILDSPEISYEHWHRYLYATRFAKGRKVLDIACGEGYGSYLLSLSAQEVIGVDISQETIDHAARKHVRHNLDFKVGSAGSIPIDGTEIFDLIVSFETIEHISDDEQHAFMVEVKRLLKKGGLFLVSTPNKSSYTDLPRYHNHFHAKEFYVQEFKAFLGEYFPYVRLLGQKIYPVSYIWIPGTDEGQMREYRLESTESGFRPTSEEKEILFALGLCSVTPIDVDTSVLVDLNETIFKLKTQRIEDLEGTLRRNEDALKERDARIRNLERALGEREAYIQHIHSGHGWRLLTKYFKLREKLLPQGTKRRLFVKTIFLTIVNGAQILGRIDRTKIRKMLYLENVQSTAPPSIAENAMHVLVVDNQIPTPDQDAGSLRMYAILKLLRDMDFAVTFVSASEMRLPNYKRQLRQLGVPVLYGYSAAVAHLTRHGHRYEFALVARPDVAFRFLPAIRAYALNSTVIYDTVDLHWVRFHRVAALSGDPALAELADRYQRMERLNAVCADLVLTVTQEEKEALLGVAPEVRVEVIPTIHKLTPHSDLEKQRKGLMFIGGFQHAPNVDAVKWFVADVFPLIQRQLVGIAFCVIGSSIPDEVKLLASPSVQIAGHVPDPEPYFKSSRVFIAPLRYGAGMKGKITQSMSYGLPVVTTSVGAEGIMLQDGENALIADGPEAFAQAVVRLYTDDVLWKKIASSCLEHVRRHFSEEAVKPRLAAIFATGKAGDRVETPSAERAA